MVFLPIRTGELGPARCLPRGQGKGRAGFASDPHQSQRTDVLVGQLVGEPDALRLVFDGLAVDDGALELFDYATMDSVALDGDVSVSKVTTARDSYGPSHALETMWPPMPILGSKRARRKTCSRLRWRLVRRKQYTLLARNGERALTKSSTVHRDERSTTGDE